MAQGAIMLGPLAGFVGVIFANLLYRLGDQL
jgi:hypothetical protein